MVDGQKEAKHVQASAWQVYDGTVAGYRDFIFPRLHAASSQSYCLKSQNHRNIMEIYIYIQTHTPKKMLNEDCKSMFIHAFYNDPFRPDQKCKIAE